MRRIDILVVLLGLTALVGLGGGMAVSATPERTIPPTLAPLPAPPVPSELREGIVGPVRTLDPSLARSPAELAISGLLFRGLTRAGTDGAVLPDLAESWEVDPDGQVLTFHLRPDARWHDGVHVSADDVVFTYESLEDIEVRRLDRFKVELGSLSGWPILLGRTLRPILPAHLLADVPAAEREGHRFGREPVGNGPFALAELSEEEVLLVRVGPPPGGLPAHYGAGPLAPLPEPTPRTAPRARAALDSYRFLLYPDQEAVEAAFAAGAVDVMAGAGPEAVRRLVDEPGVEAVVFPGTSPLALVPNLRFGTGVLRDAQVRRSLSLAIDRDAIVETVFAGYGLATHSIISPASYLFPPETVPAPAADAVAAQSGLLAAGWTRSDGGWSRPGSSEPVTIELLVGDEQAAPLDRAVAELVAEDWRSIGLAVDVVQLPPEELLEERLRPGLFDVALLEIDLGLQPDPSPLFASAQAAAGGTNLSGYQSSLVDRLLEEVRTAESAARPARLGELLVALSRELPIIPLVFPDEVSLVRGRLGGIEPRQVAEARDRYSDVLAWRLARPDE